MNTYNYYFPDRLTLKVEHWNTHSSYKMSNVNREFQIVWIQKGKGYLFVSDMVIPYQSGELYIFGQDIQPKLIFSGHTRAISLFFDQKKMEESLSNIPEAFRINKLFEFSHFGIKLPKENASYLAGYIENLSKTEGVKRFLLLLEFLDLVSKNNKYVLLSSKSTSDSIGIKSDPRMNLICNYVRKNHQGSITLKEIADVANMSPTGFCRFFKLRSQKTFSQYLSEVRIGSACDLLRNKDLSVSDCCYSSGYNYISNFNMYFKKITGMTPSEYRSNFKNYIQVTNNDLVSQ